VSGVGPATCAQGRATADETPPPTPSFDIICISMRTGMNNPAELKIEQQAQPDGPELVRCWQ
jgi:hypothetical protein